MRAVGLGIQSFEKIRSNNQFYVDKTPFIGEWYRKNDDITLITRPRRFGKTLTVDMLNCFFSRTYEGRSGLFEGLRIFSDEEMMHLQGTVPTIKLSFAGVKGKTFRELLRAIAGRISILLDGFRYLVTDGVLNEDEKKLFEEMSRTIPRIPDPQADEEAYQEFLYKLSHILHLLSIWLFRCHGKKVYIFLDEYDTPIQAAYLNHYYEEAIEFLRDMFAESFKDNDQMARAVITGITRIAKESLFSEMNNLAVYSVLSGGYDAVFGFTEDEMHTVLEEFDLIEQEGLIRNWYDGFSIGNMTKIYNPWSVISYLSKREYPPEDYWAQSGGLALVDYLLKKSGIAVKKGFETLLGGGTIWRRIREDLIFPRLDTDENAVWSLLVAAGYLKPVKESGNSPVTGLSVTNHESMICLSELVKGWFEGSSGNYMEKFADALLRGDLYEMNEEFSQAVLICASSFDSARKPSEGNAQPENFFHGLTLGMLTCLSEDYQLTSNRESGLGRYDVSIEPRDRKEYSRAFILEFKVFSEKEGDVILADTAKRARKQIDEKKYDTDLLSRGFPPDAVAKYGFGFRGKEVLITA